MEVQILPTTLYNSPHAWSSVRLVLKPFEETEFFCNYVLKLKSLVGSAHLDGFCNLRRRARHKVSHPSIICKNLHLDICW